MPSKFVGLIAAVVSILGFFGITCSEELAGVDESTVDADGGATGGGAGDGGSSGGGAATGSVTHPSTTSPPTVDESISIALVLDIGEAVEAVARVQLATGEQVDLRVDQSSTHAEQWIDLDCACRLGYEIELWTQHHRRRRADLRVLRSGFRRARCRRRRRRRRRRTRAGAPSRGWSS